MTFLRQLVGVARVKSSEDHWRSVGGYEFISFNADATELTVLGRAGERKAKDTKR